MIPEKERRNVGLSIRITEAERETFEQRARAAGLRLSDWIRETLKKAAGSA